MPDQRVSRPEGLCNKIYYELKPQYEWKNSFPELKLELLKRLNLFIFKSIAPIFSERNPFGINRAVRENPSFFLVLLYQTKKTATAFQPGPARGFYSVEVRNRKTDARQPERTSPNWAGRNGFIETKIMVLVH
jgi:hypothetical protein